MICAGKQHGCQDFDLIRTPDLVQNHSAQNDLAHLPDAAVAIRANAFPIERLTDAQKIRDVPVQEHIHTVFGNKAQAFFVGFLGIGPELGFLRDHGLQQVGGHIVFTGGLQELLIKLVLPGDGIGGCKFLPARRGRPIKVQAPIRAGAGIHLAGLDQVSTQVKVGIGGFQFIHQAGLDQGGWHAAIQRREDAPQKAAARKIILPLRSQEIKVERIPGRGLKVAKLDADGKAAVTVGRFHPVLQPISILVCQRKVVTSSVALEDPLACAHLKMDRTDPVAWQLVNGKNFNLRAQNAPFSRQAIHRAECDVDPGHSHLHHKFPGDPVDIDQVQSLAGGGSFTGRRVRTRGRFAPLRPDCRAAGGDDIAIIRPAVVPQIELAHQFIIRPFQQLPVRSQCGDYGLLHATGWIGFRGESGFAQKHGCRQESQHKDNRHGKAH